MPLPLKLIESLSTKKGIAGNSTYDLAHNIITETRISPPSLAATALETFVIFSKIHGIQYRFRFLTPTVPPNETTPRLSSTLAFERTPPARRTDTRYLDHGQAGIRTRRCLQFQKIGQGVRSPTPAPQPRCVRISPFALLFW